MRDDEVLWDNDEGLDEDDEYLAASYPPEERPFSLAWRRAVGHNPRLRVYFGSVDCLGIESKRSYRSWPPDVARIKKQLEGMPTSDAIYLAAMVSFYNGDTGGRLLRGLGAHGLSDIAAALDQERREILADLMATFRVW